MTRRALWLLSMWVMFACGREITPKQLNEPCTRPEQCDVGLVCLTGVCQPAPDAGADAGADGGS